MGRRCRRRHRQCRRALPVKNGLQRWRARHLYEMEAPPPKICDRMQTPRPILMPSCAVLGRDHGARRRAPSSLRPSPPAAASWRRRTKTKTPRGPSSLPSSPRSESGYSIVGSTSSTPPSTANRSAERTTCVSGEATKSWGTDGPKFRPSSLTPLEARIKSRTDWNRRHSRSLYPRNSGWTQPWTWIWRRRWQRRAWKRKRNWVRRGSK
mmetsp:Transcript_783/g.1768  ORF Transcript_783/g.1768 Transcript_783/m.1768 type:complete len:209 (+) Transcript_783:96-722(+)